MKHITSDFYLPSPTLLLFVPASVNFLGLLWNTKAHRKGLFWRSVWEVVVHDQMASLHWASGKAEAPHGRNLVWWSKPLTSWTGSNKEEEETWSPNLLQEHISVTRGIPWAHLLKVHSTLRVTNLLPKLLAYAPLGEQSTSKLTLVHLCLLTFPKFVPFFPRQYFL
jgi:hypothetical protein